MYISCDKVRHMLNSMLMEFRERTNLEWLMDSDSTSGHFYYYTYRTEPGYVSIGTKELCDAEKGSGFVSDVNIVSMCKQCFHEFRHYQQHHDLFLHDTDEVVARNMARQNLIIDEFAECRNDNYWNLSYEIDAEEYAISKVRDYLSRQPLFNNVDTLLIQEINRRDTWWGDRPVDNVDATLADLKRRKSVDVPLVDVNIDRSEYPLSPIAKSFYSDKKVIQTYRLLPDEQKNNFVIDYIARHDSKILEFYRVIEDEFPDLGPMSKLKRYTYRSKNNLPDDNEYESSRVLMAEERFGHIENNSVSDKQIDF